MRRSALGVVVDFAELSDPGLDPAKAVNEDASAFAETPHGLLAVVCDGMGGHVSGREASQLAVRTIVEHAIGTAVGTSPDEVLERALRRAGAAVYELGGPAPIEARPGSTCVAVLLHEGGASVAHVGDSRVMMAREGNVTRLTRDHSMVQQMLDAGLIAPEQAAAHPDANKITRALGILPDVEVEIRPGPLRLRVGDVFVLASDGLTDLVSEPEIRDAIERRLPLGPAVLCQELIELAHRRGAHDNVTVQLAHVLELPPLKAEATHPLRRYPLAPADPPSDGVARTQPAIAPAAPGGIAPTVLDEPHFYDRATQPDTQGPPLVSSPFRTASRPEHLASIPPRRLGPGPALLVVTLLIVIAIAALTIVGGRLLRGWSKDTREPPPLELEQATPPRSSERLVPFVPPAPPASAVAPAPDSSFPPAPSTSADPSFP